MTITKIYFQFILLILLTFCNQAFSQDFKDLEKHYAKLYYWSKKEAKNDLIQCPFWNDLKPGDVIADIGAFSGHIDLALSMFFDSLTFYLQENQPDRLNKTGFYEMRAHFEKENGKPFTNSFHFVIGDNLHTNLPDSTFDKVFMNNVFEFIGTNDLYLTELRGKLKKGGRVYVKTTNDFKAGYFIKIFEAYGFTCERSEYSGGQIRLVFNTQQKTLNPVTDIFDAVIQRDFDKTKAYLDKGVSANSTLGSPGLLQIAGTISNNLKIMDLLIERGANLKSLSKFIDSPLSKFAGCGQYQETKLLLDRGAKPITEDLDMAGWFSKDVRIIKLLIEKSAKIYGPDDNGSKVLLHAALGGNFEINIYLLNHPDTHTIYEKDENGQSFMHWAAHSYNVKVMKYLLEEKKFDVNEKDKEGMTVLMHAVFGGSIEMVKFLVEEKQVNINEKNMQGFTALYYAFDPEIYQYLVSRGGSK